MAVIGCQTSLAVARRPVTAGAVGSARVIARCACVDEQWRSASPPPLIQCRPRDRAARWLSCRSGRREDARRASRPCGYAPRHPRAAPEGLCAVEVGHQPDAEECCEHRQDNDPRHANTDPRSPAHSSRSGGRRQLGQRPITQQASPSPGPYPTLSSESEHSVSATRDAGRIGSAPVETSDGHQVQTAKNASWKTRRAARISDRIDPVMIDRCSSPVRRSRATWGQPATGPISPVAAPVMAERAGPGSSRRTTGTAPGDRPRPSGPAGIGTPMS